MDTSSDSDVIDHLEVDFDILDDLSDELVLNDYFIFVKINELVNELMITKMVRRMEYYCETMGLVDRHEDFCEFDFECDCWEIVNIVDCVCYDGDLDVLKWLIHNKQKIISEGEYVSACCGGHLDTIKWIHSKFPDVIEKINKDEAIFRACSNGRLDIIKWMCDNIADEIDLHDVMNFACLHMKINIVEWLHYSNNIPIPSISQFWHTIIDIKKDNLKVEYLIDKRIYDLERVFWWARMMKNADILEYMCRSWPDDVADLIVKI